MRKFNTWSRGLDAKFEDKGHAAHDAAARITTNDYLELNFNPKFKLSSDMAFYMIGSCFAREIEQVFQKEGKTVLSQITGLPKSCSEKLVGDNSAIMTKFTTHSMYSQLNQYLNDIDIPNGGLIEIGKEKFFNPQLQRLPAMSLDESIAVQKVVGQVVKKIKQADVVFITLGLTEVWWDDELDIPLNVAPVYKTADRGNKRFRSISTNFSQNLEIAHKLVDLIRSKSEKDVKIILTVSPVPLNRTFTDDDIIVANSYSKSTLRTIAQEVQAEYDFVDYFPSYELVTNSPKDKAWRHDMRHVQKEMVNHVLRNFANCYFE